MLILAVTRSSSDKNAICYVLPVLWMTSRLSAHNLPGKGNAKRAYTQNDSPGGRTEGKVWCLKLPCSPTGICQNSISVSQLHIYTVHVIPAWELLALTKTPNAKPSGWLIECVADFAIFYELAGKAYELTTAVIYTHCAHFAWKISIDLTKND